MRLSATARFAAIAAALLMAVSLQCAGPPALAAAAPPATWPHTIVADGASAVVYQPQVIAWAGQGPLTARAAIAITRPGEKPVLGTIEVQVATETDLATRTVVLSDPKLLSSQFPTLDTGQAAQLEAKIKQLLPEQMSVKEVPLDTVLLGVKVMSAPATPALDNNPPTIFYSARPASLVVFDGDPVLAPAGNTEFSFAVNTNWEVIRDPAGGGRWYLLNNGAWLVAPAFSGPFEPAGTLPDGFAKLADDPNFSDIRKSIPGRSLKAGDAPTIFVSTKPAEIIVTSGAPVFERIPGTDLQRVKNTDSTLFQYAANGRYYVLLSGRWFSAPVLDGPWAFATADLPADFARIPPSGPAGSVLPSVPGTAQAQQAVLQSQIPREATLQRAAAKLDVVYVGAPDFKPIPGTSVRYAANTTFEVLEIGGKYFACYQGAWFVAPTPKGPWALAESVPQAAYAIPPSSPVYNVTFVKPYAATPTTVTYGYTAGYLMGFLTAGVLVYGTGYYYPPVVIPGPVPAYLPYPYSYAGRAYYNPATGAWARGGTVYGPYGGAARAGAAYNPYTGAYAQGAAVYGPYGGAGAWSAYNPTTGRYTRGSAAWGPNGGTANASFYNPRYGTSGSTTQNANLYGRWGSSVVSGPNATVHTASASNSRGAVGGFQSSTGAEGAAVHGARGNAGVVKGPGGDVYAGHNGQVYQHTSSGWSSWNNGWQPVNPPKTTQSGTASTRRSGSQQSGLGATQGTSGADFQQLNQDRFARQQGAIQQRQFGEGRFGAAGGRFGGGRRG